MGNISVAAHVWEQQTIANEVGWDWIWERRDIYIVKIGCPWLNYDVFNF